MLEGLALPHTTSLKGKPLVTSGNYSTRSHKSSFYRALVLLLIPLVQLKAYADPGSGALLWQIGGAFVLGSIYRTRRFLVKLFQWIRNRGD